MANGGLQWNGEKQWQQKSLSVEGSGPIPLDFYLE